MRRSLAIVLTVAALACLGPQEASAAKPTIVGPTSFSVDLRFPDVCPDFKLAATVTGRQLTITFVDNGGNAIRGFLGGQLFVTWTNLETGFSRTFTISGPAFLDASGNQVRGAGRWTTPLEGTGWVLAIGSLTFDGTEDGFALIQSYKGRVTPLCELMAG